MMAKREGLEYKELRDQIQSENLGAVIDSRLSNLYRPLLSRLEARMDSPELIDAMLDQPGHPLHIDKNHLKTLMRALSDPGIPIKTLLLEYAQAYGIDAEFQKLRAINDPVMKALLAD